MNINPTPRLIGSILVPIRFRHSRLTQVTNRITQVPEEAGSALAALERPHRIPLCCRVQLARR